MPSLLHHFCDRFCSKFTSSCSRAEYQGWETISMMLDEVEEFVTEISVKYEVG